MGQALRQWGSGALAVVLVACAPSAPRTSAADAPAKGQGAFERALSAARRARDEAFSERAPAYAGQGDKASSLAFVTGELKGWIVRGKPRRERAMSAYRQAVGSANSDEERGLALLEGAAVARWLPDEFMRASTAAMPTFIRAEAELSGSFVRALRGATAPQYEDARSALKLCVELPGASVAKARCQAALAELPAPEPPLPSPATEGQKPSWSRPFIPTTRPSPCTFAGSLTVRGVLYGSEAGGVAVAVLDGISAVELGELSPAASAGKRAKLRIEWPIQMTAWLDTAALPFAATRRLDVVAEHVYLNAGQALQAARAAGDFVTVSADFRGQYPGIEPASFSTTLACAEVELARGAVPLRPPPGDWKALRAPAVPLHDGPRGARIAVLAQKGTYAGESRDGWVRARGNEPFAYDGWIRSADLATEPGPMGFIGSFSGPRPTHRVTKPLPVRSTDRPGAAPAGTLVPGVPLRVGAMKDGTVEIFSLVAIGGTPKAGASAFASQGSRTAEELPPWFASAADVASATESIEPTRGAP